MAKRGGSRHYKRLTVPTTLPVLGRKRVQWLLSPDPGPHPKGQAIALGVLLRDQLELGTDLREIKRILNAGHIKVDGKVVREERYAIGLMDIIEAPKSKKVWRMQIVGGRLMPKEVDAGAAKYKLCKVVGKQTIPGGKITISTHDGRTLQADNAIKVGATLKMALPTFKMSGQIPMASGVRCLVTEGKHAGETATLEKIIERVGSMDSEAQLKVGKESFVTVTKYLFIVDEEFA
jgi:small subunit ribosomal protein S4e